MSERSFLAGLSLEQRALLDKIRGWVGEYESDIETSMGEVMGAPFLKLSSAGKYKYGFTCGKHLTFHNWVMYCNPEVRSQYAGKLGIPKSRIQKSCLNLRPADKLDENNFKAMLHAGTKLPVGDF